MNYSMNAISKAIMTEKEKAQRFGFMPLSCELKKGAIMISEGLTEDEFWELYDYKDGVLVNERGEAV